MTFNDLGLAAPICKALQEQGYTHPTPIQAQSIPILLRGKDLLACAQTGTGKTAAFLLPILEQLYQSRPNKRPGNAPIRALIVTPTRELAIQIDESCRAYGRHTGIWSTAIFGGVKPQQQVKALRRGVDILIATPGRLMDLINQGFIDLGAIEHFVLDEADRMLDMGFINDIRRIIKFLPQERQSLFFSATMPSDIVKLSRQILGDYEKVAIQAQQATAERVEQSIYFVSKQDKPKLLLHLLDNHPTDSTLVFSRTKHGADKLVKVLRRQGIRADAIHGNKAQGARQRALGDFKDGKTSVLVATDIAARGIDVDELSRVINYNLPNEPETYVHRIGRTGRAQASGVALSFCDTEEKAFLRGIQKLIDQQIPVVADHPFPDEGLTSEPAGSYGHGQPSHGRGQGGGRSSNRRNHRGRNRNGRGRGGQKANRDKG